LADDETAFVRQAVFYRDSDIVGAV